MTVDSGFLRDCKVSVGGLKYRALATVSHALRNPARNSRSLRHPIRPNLDFGKSTVELSPFRLYLHRGLRFFIERWENERTKAKFEVSLLGAPQTPVELLFYLRDGQVKQAACFFELSVRNGGVNTAEKVVPIVMIPNLLALGVGLVFVSRPPLQQTAIKGPWSVKDFKGDNVASAIIDHVAIKRVDLYGGGIGQRFALFFTLSDSDRLYLPCIDKTSLRLPAKFYLTLSFQAKDMPLYSGCLRSGRQNLE